MIQPHLISCFVGLIALISFNSVHSFPYKLPCSDTMLPGNMMMGSQAILTKTRSVLILRNGVPLTSGSPFINGEILTVRISTIYTTTTNFKFQFKANNGATFTQPSSGSSTTMMCNNTRAYNLGDGTLGDVLIRMPSAPYKGIVSMWAAWAQGYGHVYITDFFTLSNLPSTIPPTFSPAYKSSTPSDTPSKAPVISKAPTSIVQQPVSNSRFTSTQSIQAYTLVLRRELVNGKSLITVNHTSPGPTLRVKLGQTLSVQVINLMGDDMGTMHWHGFDQRHTPFMDGPPGVTQCPINSFKDNTATYVGSVNQITSMNYQFQPDREGTFWYHGHYNEHYVDGQYGAIIVEDSAATTNAYETAGVSYSQETELMLADWYNAPAHSLLSSYLSAASGGNEPMPDAIVVNNAFSHTMEISVSRGTPIRVRCINAAALSMYRISVDGMPLTVIEVDGNPVKPQDFSEVTLDAAQRVSFVLDWSRLDTNMKSLTRVTFRIHAVPTMYRQYEFTDANAFGLFGSSTNTKFFTQYLGHFSFTGETSAPYYAPSYYAASDGPTTIYPKPLDSNLMQMQSLFPSKVPVKDLWFAYNITFQTGTDKVLRSYINGQTYTPPSILDRPTLFDYMSAAGGPLQEKATYAKNSQITGDAVNPFVIPFNRTIDILIRNNDGAPHPIHLHGHNFWIVSSSAYRSLSSIKRDVVSIPAMGWAIIRFVSDNPGVWLIHCHIDWHMANGFMAQIIEAPSKLKNTISSVPSDHKAACPDYFSGKTKSPTTVTTPIPTTTPQVAHTISGTGTSSSSAISSSIGSQDWSTYGFNLQRTGLNPNEVSITATSWSTIKRKWIFQTRGGVISQPVVALNYPMFNANAYYGQRRLDENSKTNNLGTELQNFEVNATTVAPTMDTPTSNPTSAITSKPNLSSYTPSKEPSYVPSAFPVTVIPSCEPSVTPTVSSSYVPTVVPSCEPSVTLTFPPSYAPTVVPSCEPSAMPTVSPSYASTVVPSFESSVTPTVSPSYASTVVPSCEPSVMPTVPPSYVPTVVPSCEPSVTPTVSPSYVPTVVPSFEPSVMPTVSPSYAPTVVPSFEPSVMPTVSPSYAPSVVPSCEPSVMPTVSPSYAPTVVPSFEPSVLPTVSPSYVPSVVPSCEPSVMPTVSTSYAPTVVPSCEPSVTPTVSPSYVPTVVPSFEPSVMPTVSTSYAPTVVPSFEPSVTPTVSPSYASTVVPSCEPSVMPTVSTSYAPTVVPSCEPSVMPTVSTSYAPTVVPSCEPSVTPTVSPSYASTVVPSCEPSVMPTVSTSYAPTVVPSCEPSVTPTVSPSYVPSVVPSCEPSVMPSVVPSYVPSVVPSLEQSVTPTVSPSYVPSVVPSCEPSVMPSVVPSYVPSVVPSLEQSVTPTVSTSYAPTVVPSCEPSVMPTVSPSYAPTVVPSFEPSVMPTVSTSYVPSVVPSFESSVTPTVSPSYVPSVVPSCEPSVMPSVVPSYVPSVVPSLEQSVTPTVPPSYAPAVVPSLHPSVTPTFPPSYVPSFVPSWESSVTLTFLPSYAPTVVLSFEPSVIFTFPPSYASIVVPSFESSVTPTVSPSYVPTVVPSFEPSVMFTFPPSYASIVVPSCEPSVMPTVFPSYVPSVVPSCEPSVMPTVFPSYVPSVVPSCEPSVMPTVPPSYAPTVVPSCESSVTLTVPPSYVPSVVPSCEPSVMPTVSPSYVPSVVPSCEPSVMPTVFPSYVPSVVPSCEPSVMPTVSPSYVPSITPTVVPSCDPSATPTVSPTYIPSITPTVVPSRDPSVTPTVSPSYIPSITPTVVPSFDPSVTPTFPPSYVPSIKPTFVPSCNPSSILSLTPLSVSQSVIVIPSPSVYPSSKPTVSPTKPTTTPSVNPTRPTISPSLLPSVLPSWSPITSPSISPSVDPTVLPSISPSFVPSTPTVKPSVAPTRPTVKPSSAPSFAPSKKPTSSPSVKPSQKPSFAPSKKPTSSPSVKPSQKPSFAPSKKPTSSPSVKPSQKPSFAPSKKPTIAPSRPTSTPSIVPSAPTLTPTYSPTFTPSCTPSNAPSTMPTFYPSVVPSRIPTYNPTIKPTVQTIVTSVTVNKRNVAYIGDETGWFYAIDIDTGSLLWETFLGYTRITFCSDLAGGNFSITGTPVFDRSINTVYVVGGAGSFNALSMSAGNILWKIPNFYDPQHLHNYGALLLYNNVVYVTMGAMCDLNGVYLGGVYSVDTITRTVKNYFAPYQGAKAGSYGGGIWGLGGLTLGDMSNAATSYIYTPTGNCMYTGAQDSNYCEKLIKLDLNLNVVGSIRIPLGTKPDNDLGSSITYFNSLAEGQTSGCKIPLVAGFRKDGLFAVARADTFTPTQFMQIGNPNGAGSIQQAAWDPTLNILVVPQGSSAVATAITPAYTSSLIGFSLNATCGLNKVWATPINSMSSPTIIGAVGKRLALVTAGFGLYAVNAQTGVSLGNKNLLGSARNAPVIVNGVVLMGIQGIALSQRGLEAWS